jgi:hypothetical protein
VMLQQSRYLLKDRTVILRKIVGMAALFAVLVAVVASGLKKVSDQKHGSF